MRAATINRYGGPEVITIMDVPRPQPGEGQALVRVHAAGIGNWDALIREGKSVVAQSLPLTLGSDLSGVVHSVGPGVADFHPGDEVYGATNPDFVGAYADYAIASADMIATKPKALSFVDAASAPVVAVTAWQMLFEYAQLRSGQMVLIQGGAGNVGAYAVQLAKHAGIRVIATVGPADRDYVSGLGADEVIDYTSQKFEDAVHEVDAVIDTVGGETRKRSYAVLRKGGTLVSAVNPISADGPVRDDVRSTFFIVKVTKSHLDLLSPLFESGSLKTDVGPVLPLEEVRTAHLMLAGMPHKRGRIVLDLGLGAADSLSY